MTSPVSDLPPQIPVGKILPTCNWHLRLTDGSAVVCVSPIAAHLFVDGGSKQPRLCQPVPSPIADTQDILRVKFQIQLGCRSSAQECLAWQLALACASSPE